LASARIEEVSACKVETTEVAKTLMVAQSTIGDVEKMLASETSRGDELQAALDDARAQISELQATLKDTYMAQFEEAQKRQSVEQRYSALIGDVQPMRTEREGLLKMLDENRKEIAEQRNLAQMREKRLHETSGELSRAEHVIDGITNQKCIGTQRFFERYNLPGVLLSLFRKTLELHGQLRSKSGLLHKDSVSSLGSGGQGLLVRSPCSPCSGGSTPSSPTSSPTAKGSCMICSAEVRSALSLHKDGAVSRHVLQSFIEGLHLTQVSAPMATQVLLALLDLDLGAAPCDVSHFAAALASPPAWESSRLAKATWGSIGEPIAAAAEAQQARRRSTTSGKAIAAAVTTGALRERALST